ncbi:MAG TPA: carboxylesterase family protein [Diaminobutyricibacter sp.]
MAITISSGPIEGTSSDGVDRYLGIPYAAAPVGARRFAGPTPHPGWTEVRDATSFGPTAPQAPYSGALRTLLPSVEIPGDEYLNLNVWAPSGGSDLPVMVWVHGGSLVHGANALDIYDGTAFARDGVVFVSINYRLGAEGFSVIGEAPLNLGLQDVVAALRWVQAEIGVFGGDPSRVTVAGESAGAILLGALLPNRKVSGLFARMILQSGLPAAAPRARVAKISGLMAKRLGIPASRATFAARDASELVATQQAVTAGSTPITGGVSFSIAIGDDLVPTDPRRAVLAGAGDRIPLLIGSNTEEYRLWFVPTGLMSKITATLFAAARVRFRISRRILDAYKAAHPGASRGELFGVLATDIILRLPLNRIADARLTRRAETYVYEFSWSSTVQALGAAHAMELGFVFDRLDSPDVVAMAGVEAPQQLADDMHGAWVRFVKSGDPGWEKWSSRRPVQTFDAPASQLVYAPHERERAAWK